MSIANKKVVTLDYTLKDDAGNVIDQSQDGSFVYLHGEGGIIPGLETALVGKAVNEELSISVAPDQAYGEKDPAKAQTVNREMFEDANDLEVGRQFHAAGPDGEEIVITITAIDGDEITIDGNHPLAGMTLHFNIKVIDIRDASEEELAHGHVHGPHGHHH